MIAQSKNYNKITQSEKAHKVANTYKNDVHHKREGKTHEIFGNSTSHKLYKDFHFPDCGALYQQQHGTRKLNFWVDFFTLLKDCRAL